MDENNKWRHFYVVILEKAEFDEELTSIQSQLDVTALGSSGIHQQYEEFKEREQALVNRVCMFILLLDI